MQEYMITEEEVKQRQELSQVARKYITLNSYELSQALISLGTTITLRGYKEAGDELEAAAILLNIKEAVLTELAAGSATIKWEVTEPFKLYKLKGHLNVPNGDYALIPIAPPIKEEGEATDETSD